MVIRKKCRYHRNISSVGAQCSTEIHLQLNLTDIEQSRGGRRLFLDNYTYEE